MVEEEGGGGERVGGFDGWGKGFAVGDCGACIDGVGAGDDPCPGGRRMRGGRGRGVGDGAEGGNEWTVGPMC